MLETEDADLLDEDIEMQNAETDLEFIVNQPFMAILQVDHEILAVGRIKDPLWCKTCSEKPQGYIDISNEMMFDKGTFFSKVKISLVISTTFEFSRQKVGTNLLKCSAI